MKYNKQIMIDGLKRSIEQTEQEIEGKVVEKGRHGKLYTITIRDYGVFVVTKEVYEKVKVGDEVRL